ncbi:major facilitator superfamily domain-containing protein [Ditylenchus destructor]|nr:major facilitator superfamily domain-containing protein [Ditylenchus destructor]
MVSKSYSITSKEKPECGVFCNKFRFFILLLATFCMSAIFSNMITLNFTIICMGSQAKMLNLDVENITQSETTVHDYTQYEKTVLQWSVSIAAMIATFPFSYVCTHYGAKYVFFATGMLSTLSTAFVPAASNLGFHWFILARIFQGFAYASDFAVIGVICTRWASLKENAKFLSVLTCFSPLASMFTNSISGVICDSELLGWPWVYYFHAMVSFVLFMAWMYFYTDDVQDNDFISQKELEIIFRDKSDAHKYREAFVPYKEIVKSKVVWTVWLNAYADLFSGYFLIIYAPTYLKHVLKYSKTETGFFGAIIAAVHIPIKLCAGYISDSFNCFPERYKMWIFNSIALLSPAAIYIYVTFAPADIPSITVLMFGLVHATLGFNCGGFYKCGALVSRQYAEVVIAFTQFIKCAVFFIAPALVALFVEHEANASQWFTIFYIIAGSLIFANAVFCVYATIKPRSFTNITMADKKQRERKIMKCNVANSDV